MLSFVLQTSLSILYINIESEFQDGSGLKYLIKHSNYQITRNILLMEGGIDNKY